MTLGLVGPQDEPFAGRAWVRRFPSGEVEMLYRAGRGPGELERLNEWLKDAGIENRVTRLSPPGYGRAPVEDEGWTAEQNADRSKRRAKQAIRWAVKSIGCDQMLTLTYREEVTEFADTRKHFSRFVALCRREWPEWKYVAAPEIQPTRLERTGVAVWHWHVGVKGFQNYDKLRAFWWRAMGYRVRWSAEGKPELAEGVETPGGVNGQAARSRGRVRRTWAADRMAGYLAKYVSKSIGADGIDGKSYSVSRGLKWATERYCVRAFTFSGVASACFSAMSAAGVLGPHVWQSDDRSVLWMAGRAPPGSDPPNAH